MRALVRFSLILSGLLAAPAYAAESLYCDMPAANQVDTIVESRVHPIWHVDPGYLDLGYIDDSYAPVNYEVLVTPSQTISAAPAEQDFGVRLQNGWLLGLTYETIDTSLRIGTEVVEESVGPVYEGPMFVATWKFR